MPDNLKIVDLGLSKQQQNIIRLINNGGAFFNPVKQDINDVMQLLENDIDELIEIYTKSDSCSEDSEDWAFNSIMNEELHLLIKKLKRLKYELEEFKNHTDRLSGVTLHTDEVYITPRIIIEDEHGTGAYAVPVIENGQIKSINVVHSGTGYGGSNIVIRSVTGHGAEALITELDCNGGIAGIEVVNGGSNYEHPIIILDNSYIGAEGTVNMCLYDHVTKEIERVEKELEDNPYYDEELMELLGYLYYQLENEIIIITNNGEGYLTIPTVNIRPPERRTATISNVILEKDSLDSIIIKDGGSGYLDNWPVKIIAAEEDRIVPAEIIKFGVNKGEVISVRLTGSTCGWRSAPNIVFQSPEELDDIEGSKKKYPNPYEERRSAQAIAKVKSQGRICNVIITNGGCDYDEETTEVIGIDGCVSNYELTIDNNGTIIDAIIEGDAKAVHVVDNNPILSKRGKGARIVVFDTIIDEIELIDGGSGYTDVPDIILDYSTTGLNTKDIPCQLFPKGEGVTGVGTINGNYDQGQGTVNFGSNPSHLWHDGKLVPIMPNQTVNAEGSTGFILSYNGTYHGNSTPGISGFSISWDQENNEIKRDGNDPLPPGEVSISHNGVTIIELTPSVNDLLVNAEEGSVKIGLYPQKPTIPLEDFCVDGGQIRIKGNPLNLPMGAQNCGENSQERKIVIGGEIKRLLFQGMPGEDASNIPPLTIEVAVTANVIDVIAPNSFEISGFGADECSCYMFIEANSEPDLDYMDYSDDPNNFIPGGSEYTIAGKNVPSINLACGGDFVLFEGGELEQDIGYEITATVSGSFNGHGVINGGIGYSEDDLDNITKEFSFTKPAHEFKYPECLDLGRTGDKWNFPDLDYFIAEGSIVGFEIKNTTGTRRLQKPLGGELERFGCPAGVGFDGMYAEESNEIELARGPWLKNGAKLKFSPPEHARDIDVEGISYCGSIVDYEIIDHGSGYVRAPSLRVETPLEQYERVKNELGYTNMTMDNFIKQIVTPQFKIPRLRDDSVNDIEIISRGEGGYPDNIELIINPPEFTEFEDSEVYGVVDCAPHGKIYKEKIRITKSNIDLINPRLLVLGTGLGAQVNPIINADGILTDFNVINKGTCYSPDDCKERYCVTPDIEAGYQFDIFCQSDTDNILLWSGISKTPSGLYTQRCGSLGGCVTDLPYMYICRKSPENDNELIICSSEITINESKSIIVKLDNKNIGEWNYGDNIYMVIKNEEDCKDPTYTYTKIGVYHPCSQDEEQLDENEIRILTDISEIPSGFPLANGFIPEEEYNIINSVNYLPLYGFVDGEEIIQGTKKLTISKVYDDKLIVFGSDLETWNTNEYFFGKQSKVCNIGSEYIRSIDKLVCENCDDINMDSEEIDEWNGSIIREGSREIWKIISEGKIIFINEKSLNTLISKLERKSNIAQCPPIDFGRSISMYENYSLIGSSDAKSVYLFKRGNVEWKQITRISNETDEGFGYKVSLHKNVMAIYSNTTNKIYIYEGWNDNWIKTQEIEIKISHCSMKITNDYLVIGLCEPDLDYMDYIENKKTEKVQIYTRNPKDTDCNEKDNWTLTHTLESGYTNIDYGFSVDIQKNWLAVGAISGSKLPMDNPHGVVFIYKYYDEYDMWIEQDRLVSNEPDHTESRGIGSFGYDLSFDPDCCRIAIGNPVHNEVEIHECTVIEDKDLYINECAGGRSDYQKEEDPYTPNSYRVIFTDVLPCRSCSYFITIGHDYCLEQIDNNVWAKNLGEDNEVKLVASDNKFKLEVYGIDDNIDERMLLFRGEIDIDTLTSEYEIENEFGIGDCDESAGYDGRAKLIPCCIDPNLPDKIKVQKYGYVETIENTAEGFGQSLALESPYITIGADKRAFEYVKNENIIGENKIWNFVKEFYEDNGYIIGSAVARSQMFSAINNYDNSILAGSVCFYQLSGLYAFVTGVGCDALIHPVPDVCYQKIDKINIDNPGRGYQLSNRPIEAYVVGGAGCGAKIIGNTENDSIKSFDVISSGCDYVTELPNIFELISALSLSNILLESIDERDKSLDKPFVKEAEVIDRTFYRVEYIPVNTHLDPIQKGMKITGSESGATALFDRYETEEDAVFGGFTGNHVYIYNVKGKFKEGEIVRTEMNTQSMHIISGPIEAVTETGMRPKTKDPNEGYIKYIDDEGNTKYKKPEQTSGPVDNFTRAFNSLFHGSEYMNYIRQILKDGINKQLERADNPNSKLIMFMNLVDNEINRLCNAMRDDHREYMEAKRIINNYNLADMVLSQDDYIKLLIKTIGNETLINNLED